MDSNLGLHFCAFLLEAIHLLALLLEGDLKRALTFARLDLLDRCHQRLDLKGNEENEAKPISMHFNKIKTCRAGGARETLGSFGAH